MIHTYQTYQCASSASWGCVT